MHLVNEFFDQFQGEAASHLGLIDTFGSTVEFEEKFFRHLENLITVHYLPAQGATQRERRSQHAVVGCPGVRADDRSSAGSRLRGSFGDHRAAAPCPPTDRRSRRVDDRLEGGGGFGKTALAKWACHQEEVRQHFADGILWVSLGVDVSDSDLTAKCRDLTSLFSPTSPRFDSPGLARSFLGQIIGQRKVLLVVDDVWDPDHLEVFMQGAVNCTRLVTTRTRALLPTGTTAWSSTRWPTSRPRSC